MSCPRFLWSQYVPPLSMLNPRLFGSTCTIIHLFTTHLYHIWSLGIHCLRENCAQCTSPTIYLCATKETCRPLTLGMFPTETVIHVTGWKTSLRQWQRQKIIWAKGWKNLVQDKGSGWIWYVKDHKKKLYKMSFVQYIRCQDVMVPEKSKGDDQSTWTKLKSVWRYT